MKEASVSLAALATLGASKQAAATDYLLGYTEYRTNLPGGRFPNTTTMRACVVRADGKKRRMLAKELAKKPDFWTQFAGWSPDGKLAIIGNGWEDPKNAAWEEEHKTFRMTEGWLYDMYLLDMDRGTLTNMTAIERVSIYNTGLFFVQDGTGRLGFQAMVGANSHPFVMDRDGRNKKDISEGAEGFAYGFSASPDGKRVSYHKDYQVYVADTGGANARKIDTGNPFNFSPQWSPDGQWIMFVSGEHYNCHPCIVRPDGTGLRKVGDRGGYRGAVSVLDVYDFHDGSSDIPVWSPDSKSIYFTAQSGKAVELCRTDLEGHTEVLTHSPEGALNYHPALTSDGVWIAFGSTRSGTRQLYVMPAKGGEAHAVTHVKPGWGAMWARWRPKA